MNVDSKLKLSQVYRKFVRVKSDSVAENCKENSVNRTSRETIVLDTYVL